MQELLDWYIEENENNRPLVIAALLHYKFVCIHPFGLTGLFLLILA